MKQTLTPDQISDLAAIRKICDEMDTDVVVIGATALLLLIGDIGRFTRDVDLTVALDLSEFGQFIQRLLSYWMETGAETRASLGRAEPNHCGSPACWTCPPTERFNPVAGKSVHDESVRI